MNAYVITLITGRAENILVWNVPPFLILNVYSMCIYTTIQKFVFESLTKAEFIWSKIQ